MKTKKMLLLVFMLLCMTCLVFAACVPQVNSNAISGLEDISLHCGDALPQITATAEYGTITVTIAKAVDGTEKENLSYAAVGTDGLTYGTYYIKASVDAGENYEAAVAYAKVTVSHQDFASISGEGTPRDELTSEGKYHSWVEKPCACGIGIRGDEQTKDREANAIIGLEDSNFHCGDVFNKSSVSATHGEVTVEIKWNDTVIPGESFRLSHGTYTVTATVAASKTYLGATKTATFTVAHQAFDDIEGNGEFHSEKVGENQYEIWYMKQCDCGSYISSEKQTVSKEINEISGLVDVSLVCRQEFDASGISATHGTPSIEIKDAYGTVVTGILSHGTYTVTAKVEETDDYLGATETATITVNHQALEDIAGDLLHQKADYPNTGYDYKRCVCGEKVKGDKEYVRVIFMLDDDVLETPEVAIGDTVKMPDASKLPSHEGYKLILLDSEGEVWNAGETVSDYVTINLTSKWLHESEIDLEVVPHAQNGWMFNEGTGLGDKTNTLTHDTENGVWVIRTLFNHANPYSPAEVTLGNVELKLNHTYTFKVVSDHVATITFGTGTWDASTNHPETGNTYRITESEVGEEIVITITYTGSTTIVSYNGAQRIYTNEEWPTHNLNGLSFAIQDKPEDISKDGDWLNISISDVLVDAFDYVAEDARLVASLPEVSAIDENNAEDVIEIINQIEAARTFFLEGEKDTLTDVSAHKAAAQAVLADHNLQLRKLEAALPDFDTILAADKDAQDAAFVALTKYLAYYNVKFTAEEKADYTEPEKIAKYRAFFADRTVVTDNASAQFEGHIAVEGNNKETLLINGANGDQKTSTLTLPKVAYAAYSQVTFIFQLSGEIPVQLVYGGQTFTSTTEGYSWVQFNLEKKDDGWYLSGNNLTLPESGQTVSVKLDDAIALGNEAVTMKLTTKGWSAVVVRGGGDDGSRNKFLGTLDATGATTVHKVKFSYDVGNGEVSSIGYYLNDGKLVLPEAPASYTDAIGKHTLVGWFAGDTEYKAGDAVTSALQLVAKYEVKEGDYTVYEVAFINEDGDELADAKEYHYGEKLVLPADPTVPTYDGEGNKHYEFAGWFDDSDKQYVGGETITAELELIAKFNLVDDDREEFTVTLTNLDGDNQEVKVLDGDAAELPEVTRSGYIFDAWYLNGEKFDAETPIDCNVTLVARWLTSNAYLGGTNLCGFDGYGTAITDGSWTDTQGNAYSRYWTSNSDTFYINLPQYAFTNSTAFEFMVEVKSADGKVCSFTCDDVSSDGGYMGENANIGWTFSVRIYKDGTAWKITTKQWTKELDATVFDDGVLKMHTWTDVENPEIKISDIHIWGNVDYVATAASTADVIADLATDADQATKVAALKQYYAWRAYFTSYELVNIAIPEAVTTLKQELAGVTYDIWTATDTNYDDIGYVSYVDNKSHSSWSDDASNWRYAYNNGSEDYKRFLTANQYNLNGSLNDVSQTSLSRDPVFVLPEINYAAHSDVWFMVMLGTNDVNSYLSIGGITCPLNNGSTNYVVHIKTVDGVTTFEVKYCNENNVVASGTLSTSVANGLEALALSIHVESWSSVSITEIIGTF